MWTLVSPGGPEQRVPGQGRQGFPHRCQRLLPRGLAPLSLSQLQLPFHALLVNRKAFGWADVRRLGESLECTAGWEPLPCPLGPLRHLGFCRNQQVPFGHRHGSVSRKQILVPQCGVWWGHSFGFGFGLGALCFCGCARLCHCLLGLSLCHSTGSSLLL